MMFSGLVYRMLRCVKGRIIWHKIIKRNPVINNTAIILLPEKKCLDNYFALIYLDRFLIREKRDNAVLISQDERVIKQAESFSKHVSRVIYLDDNSIKCLLQYALLYEFDNRLVIASLDIPKGRFGSRLIGKGNMNREEVFAVGVYKLHLNEVGHKERKEAYKNE